MFCECGRAKWQHTAELLSVLVAANWDSKKNGKPPSSMQLNPWEAKLKVEPEPDAGFKALKGVASQWRRNPRA